MKVSEWVSEWVGFNAFTPTHYWFRKRVLQSITCTGTYKETRTTKTQNVKKKYKITEHNKGRHNEKNHLKTRIIWQTGCWQWPFTASGQETDPAYSLIYSRNPHGAVRVSNYSGAKLVIATSPRLQRRWQRVLSNASTFRGKNSEKPSMWYIALPATVHYWYCCDATNLAVWRQHWQRFASSIVWRTYGQTDGQADSLHLQNCLQKVYQFLRRSRDHSWNHFISEMSVLFVLLLLALLVLENCFL